MDNKALIYPNKFKTSVYLKNNIKAKNVIVGDYSYYDAPNSNPLDSLYCYDIYLVYFRIIFIFCSFIYQD